MSVARARARRHQRTYERIVHVVEQRMHAVPGVAIDTRSSTLADLTRVTRDHVFARRFVLGYTGPVSTILVPTELLGATLVACGWSDPDEHELVLALWGRLAGANYINLVTGHTAAHLVVIVAGTVP